MVRPFVYDIAIIGGGINGTAIAADAAQRGLSVVLFEKDDLASKTSSSSTKLIHGGLRYLEQYDFAMVKKALTERQRLLHIAAHLVEPMPFVLPYQPAMRPFWFLKAGLMLYDNLSRANKLPKSKAVRQSSNAAYFLPLKPTYQKGHLYYDCVTDDCRLTIAYALQARLHGANIHSRAQVINAWAQDGLWQLSVDHKKGLSQDYTARAVINAAGPWVSAINALLHVPDHYQLSLIKGSHLLMKPLYSGNYAYLFQHPDKRIIFIVPYHGFSMVGTTDVCALGGAQDYSISVEEIEYLIGLLNSYLLRPVSKEDIVFSWSGVRTLLQQEATKAQALSRDYAFHLTCNPAPALTIYSGKLTTARQLAEEAVNNLQSIFPGLKASATATTLLPGANLNGLSLEDYYQQVLAEYPWLPQALARRYVQYYGSEIHALLKNCRSLTDLGQDFGAGLYQQEVDYLRDHEWAESAEDVLWRRTKLGLHFPKENLNALSTYLNNVIDN